MVTVPGIIAPGPASRATKLSYLTIPIWTWAMTCIKTSIAMTLLCIKNTLRWKIFLFSIIGLQAAYCVGNTVFIFTLCKPMRAAWDISLTSTNCPSPDEVRLASNVGSSVNILTDILLSLSLMIFLRKLHRSLRERILLCILMGLGLLATVFSIIKTVAVQHFGTTSDGLTWYPSLVAWTVIEELVAVFAACAPFLKPWLERILSYFGLDYIPSHAGTLGVLPTLVIKSTTNSSIRDQIVEEHIEPPDPIHHHTGIRRDPVSLSSPASTKLSAEVSGLGREE